MRKRIYARRDRATRAYKPTSRPLRAAAVAALAVILGVAAGPRTAISEPAAVSDRGIAMALENKLLYDDAIDEHALDVRAQSGVVTLSGSPLNILAKERAIRHAETIRGVRAVIDRMNVDVPPRSAEALLEDVIGALRANPATEAFDTRLSVEDGVVTIGGAVQSWAEHDLTEDVVKRVRGVRRVENRLAIDTTSARPSAEIAKEVKARIRYDVWVDDRKLDVRVDNGIVKLSGAVGSAMAVSRVQQLARVAGVKSVDVSDLEVDLAVRTPGLREDGAVPTDDTVEAAVRSAISHDPRILTKSVDVDAERGRVRLFGTVGSLQAKSAAAEDARNTVGVLRVIDHLKVRPPTERDDRYLLQNTREALRRDPFVDEEAVGVAVENGVVTLHGAADSRFEREWAERVASRGRGVAAVHNRMTVAEHGRPTPDWALREDIEGQLGANPFVDAEGVAVEVDRGVATLTGTVDSAVAFRQAERSAYHAGAMVVRNRLTIRVDGWRG